MSVDTLHRNRIDFKNDPTTAVPASLQRSAVLQALEEEERQKQAHQPIDKPRQSRSRLRDIDRETVLKINRRPRHRSADYVWPPRHISPTPKINEPLKKRPTPTSTVSRSHQNINEIKDIFEHQSNRSEPNTLTRLLQKHDNINNVNNIKVRNEDEANMNALKNKNNKIDNNRKNKRHNDDDKNDDDEKENIIFDDNNNKNKHRYTKIHHINTDNNRKILSSSPPTTEKKEEDQKILYKNIHLWPPISSSSSSQYNLNKKSSVRRMTTKTTSTKNDTNEDDIEQIIKRHFHIIDKNYDENLGKYEENINFHDWHGLPEKASNEDGVDNEGRGKDSMTPLPPPRSSSKLIDLSQYMHDIYNTAGIRSSNASPTVSEFTRIYDNIVEPTAYLNISDLESIFSTNTAYSESTMQTTVEWPPTPQLPSLNDIIKSNVKAYEHDQTQNYNKKPQSKQETSAKLIDNVCSNVTMQPTTFSNNDNDNKNHGGDASKAKIPSISPIIPMNLNNKGSNEGNNIIDDETTTTDAANECNQQYLFDSHKNNNITGECLDGCYNYNKHKFGLDCQIMTNCGNENYNDDKATTAANIEIKGCDQRENTQEKYDMIKLAERIKGKCYTDGEYIVIPYDIFVREFGPICASSTDDNSQTTTTIITDNNDTDVVDNSNETEQQKPIQSSSCYHHQINEQQQQQKLEKKRFFDDDNQPNNVQITDLSCEKLKSIKEYCESSSTVSCVSNQIFANNVIESNDDTNNIEDNRKTTSSNLIKFNDDDNDCYNNTRCCSDRIVTAGRVPDYSDPVTVDNAIKDIFNELNANLQRSRTSIHPAVTTTTTFNIPLIDDIIEDLVLFSQQLLLPRATVAPVVKADVIEIGVVSETDRTNESNLSDIDIEKCNKVNVRRSNDGYGDVFEENDMITTTTMDIEHENNNYVMNDEDYEKWFYINNTGLTVVLPFVV